MPVSPFAPPQRRKPEGPVTAVNPQLTGLAQGVSQMASQNAAAAQRNAQGGPSYFQRQMANSPAPSPGLGLAGMSAPAAPQVSHGVPQSTFFQGATPGQVAYSGGQRPGFLGAPAPAGGVGQADQNQWAVANGKYIAPTGAMANSNIFGNMSNQQVKTAGITGRGPNQATLTPEQANAGYAAAKTAAAGRQKASREQTLNRVAIRGQNKQAGFENALAANLAQRDPQAFAQAMTARGQLGLANSNMQSTNAFRDRQLAQQKELGLAQIAGLNDRAKLAVDAKNPPEKPPEAFSNDDYKQMNPKDAAEHMLANKVPPAEVNKRMQEITGFDHNWVQYPTGPGFFAGAKPANPKVAAAARAKGPLPDKAVSAFEEHRRKMERGDSLFSPK